MVTQNFTPGVGRLTTDRFDFEKHVDGSDFTHDPTGIKLDPPVSINTLPSPTTVDNLQDAIEAIASVSFPPIINDATATVKGVVKLAGDLSASTGGSADVPRVTGIQGYPVLNQAPIDGQLLTWDNSGPYWKPGNITALQGIPVPAFPTINQFLKYDGTQWVSSKIDRLQGYTVSSSAPGTNEFLKYDGSNWASSKIDRLQGYTVSSSAPGTNEFLKYDGSNWASSKIDSLQGYTVSSTAPTTGKFLKYNSSSWVPSDLTEATSSVKGVINLTGDLSGTASSPEVVSITGVYSVANLYCSLMIDKDQPFPIIYQDSIVDGDGEAFLISAQSASIDVNTENNGGSLILCSGSGAGTGTTGSLYLSLGNPFIPLNPPGNAFLNLAHLNSSQRVLGLLSQSGVTDSQMPAGTGDIVVYLEDAATNPTTNPIDGSILYSSGGKLYTYQEDGYNFSLDSEPNPKTKTVVGAYGTSKIIKWTGAKKSISASEEIFRYNLSKGTVWITGTMMGVYTPGLPSLPYPNSVIYDVNICYEYNGVGLTSIITTNQFTSVGTPTLTALTSPPSVTFSGNDIIISTGYKSGVNISWTINLEMHCNYLT